MFGFLSNDKVKALKLENASLKNKILKSEDEILSYIKKLENASFSSAAEEENHRKEVEGLKLKIENLERERDILRKYYDLDSEPTPDMKADMRLYERIHELELENIELRGRINRLTDSANALIQLNSLSYLNNAAMRYTHPLYF